MRVMIVDIGNTHIHTLVFEQNKFQMEKVYSSLAKTPRDEPKNLAEEVRKEIYTATDGKKDIDGIMINSFSGAFIYAEKFYFANAKVPEFFPTDQEHEILYKYTGQNNKYGLVGFPALLRSVTDHSETPPLSPHQYVCEKVSEWSSIKTRIWDITHASRSGIYNLVDRRWCVLDDSLFSNKAARLLGDCSVGFPAQCVGSIRSIPLYSGGLDHSFISAYHSKAYIGAGTWTNIVQIEPRFEPNLHGTKIRWGIVADGRMAKEIVYKSDANMEITKGDLKEMNFTSSVILTGKNAHKLYSILSEERLSYGMAPQEDLEQKAAAYYLCRVMHDQGAPWQS